MNVHNHIRLCLLLTIGLVLTPALLSAAPEEPDPAPTATESRSDSFLSSVGANEARIWTSPFRLTTKQALLWTGAVAVTWLLIKNDEAIYRNFKKYQSDHSWVSDISPKITRLPELGPSLGITGAFFLSGVLFKDEKARETGRLLLESLIHTGFVVQVGKHLAGRQRPSVSGKDHWNGPAGFFKRYEDGFSRYDAFPSGHTITMWGMATVVAEQYRKTVWVPIASYSIATLVGLSRVTEDAHWLSDVFVGAVLGFAIGKMVVRERKKHLQIMPVTGRGAVGVGIYYEIGSELP